MCLHYKYVRKKTIYWYILKNSVNTQTYVPKHYYESDSCAFNLGTVTNGTPTYYNKNGLKSQNDICKLIPRLVQLLQLNYCNCNKELVSGYLLITCGITTLYFVFGQLV